MKERSAFWDNYKGLLIFLVVFGHFIYSYATKTDNDFVKLLYTFIYTFHMPAFIFCSGYFSKSINARSSKAACKMILCYLIFNTAMMLFAYFYLGSGFKLLTPYYSFWYIISLVCWRSFIGYVDQMKLTIPLAFLSTLLIGYWGEFTNIFSIRRTVAFFVFFAIGYFLDKEKIEAFISKRSAKTYALGAVLALAFLIVVPYVIHEWEITFKMTLMGTYKDGQDLYMRMLLLIIAVVAIFIFMLLVPNRKIPFLSQFGRNSLLIYLGHRFLTIIFYNDLFPAKTYSEEYLLYAFVATVITCIVLGNEWLSARFNKAIGGMTEKIMNPNDTDGNKLKTVIVAGFIICLMLKPILN